MWTGSGCCLAGKCSGSVKLVFNIKIMTKNGVIFYAYLQREYKIGAVLASTGVTMSIEKAHIMTRHHKEE